MPSPSKLNSKDLLAPIAGADPAGAPLDYLVEQELDAARKDYEPHPEGPVPKKPEWDRIITVAVGQLANKSKDLRLAVRLAEALTKQEGFAGLRDGLQLIRLLVEECWDRVHPVPDTEAGEGMEVRADLLSGTLADPDAGPSFPHTIRAIPLVKIDEKPFSLRDKKLSDEDRGPIPRNDFERARAVSADIAEDLIQALEELKKLNGALAARMDQQAPNLTRLEDAMIECRQFLQHVQGEEPAAPPANGQPAAAAPVTGATPLRGAATREECYRQLNQIANVLESLEPHSPIPDLLRRAVELGKMPFRRLIREIVRDQNLLGEVNREFGIKEPQPPEG
jgi:type VI secretion system protein ImpA